MMCDSPDRAQQASIAGKNFRKQKKKKKGN
jgi:hypothetical protein